MEAWPCQERPTIGSPLDGLAPNWRFFWDYGNTEPGNQGVHMLDVALMGIDKLLGGSASRCRRG